MSPPSPTAMSLESASSSGLHLRPPLPSSPLGRPRFAPAHLRTRKTRRLRLLARLGPPPPHLLSLPFDNLLPGILSAFPSAHFLDLIVPALGFASGAAFFFSSLGRREGVEEADAGDVAVGEWILFASPTPFNRCVLLRCPSVSFGDGGELTEGVSDRLVTEERHRVNLSRGRIVAERGKVEEAGDGVSYQRLCVGAGDGGVISLDWPENLELGSEQGLDTTVVLVPGTTEGSTAGNVRAFVHEALRHGCFPIVMNPRGCAGSPLTTSRLFTAADSDDVSAAIQFINKSRPWATLMGIGWGYGANMLTKYLTEVGERTPLTAAVCIDNPFDLNEATKSSPQDNEMDNKLIGGLVDILRANKELFQGKNRGFNVAKALSAKTVRDFEAAISMISYGFKAIEDFYSKSSTSQLVHRVKIPLLFIQSDDGTVPLFSIPCNSITENPFTSLLSCSCLPSNIMRNERFTLIWCQNLAIEWLSAVELALLKGRHPLLNDVDISITPPKSTAMLEGRLSENGTSIGGDIHGVLDSYIHNGTSGNFLKLLNSNAASGFLMDPISALLDKDDCTHEGKANDSETLGVDPLNVTKSSQQSSLRDAGDAGSVKVDDSSVDSERSQVLGAATVILNMLDVTVPGTLGDEQKKKVLTAMDQGESFMKALQGAVPEDVRGKLTAAVSEIIQAEGNKIRIDNFKKIGWVPSILSVRKSRIQEQPGDISAGGGPNGTPSTDSGKSGANNQERVQGDLVSHLTSDHDAPENKESSREKSPEAPGYAESKSEVEGNQSQSCEPEMASGSPDTSDKVSQNHRVDDRQEDGHVSLEANDHHYSEAKKADAYLEEKMTNSSSNHEEYCASDSSSFEHRQLLKVGNDIQENNSENVQNSKKFEEPSSNHSLGNPPSLCVSQALDALAGFDDSTQMAVNSVFGVIENMIDQLEKETGKNGSEQRKDGLLEADDVSKESLTTSNHKSNNIVMSNASSMGLDGMQSGLPQARVFEKPDTHETVVEQDEKKLSYDLHSSDSDAFANFPGNSVTFNNVGEVGSIQSVLLDFCVNPCWELPYRGYLHKYFSAHMSDMKALDSQPTTDLFLDPEEGSWKMLDQIESSNSIHNIEDNQSINRDETLHSTLQEADGEAIIEPSYAILETDIEDLAYGSRQKTLPNNNNQGVHNNYGREELNFLVKDAVLEALKVEVARRVGMPDLKEIDSNIMHDLERVSDAVSHAVMHYSELSSGHEESSSVKFGTIQGQQIIRTISSVAQDTNHLGKVLPVGVMVGSILASLRRYFHVTVLHDDHQVEADTDRPIDISYKEHDISNGHHTLDTSHLEEPRTAEASGLHNDSAMVGAVTAALGASTLLAHHQRNKAHKSSDCTEISSGHMKVEESCLKLEDKLEEVVQEKIHSNLVCTLAEKAMSVAGPVVPTKNDGEVDHERLVATLAELGQKGGMLRLIGKLALLWGGIRGAMSLTDRLISFLHIAERPLLQRILGFISMVLVLWSPVVIPLLPTLVESWTLKSSTGIAGYACTVGLYVAIMILVVLWGRRIRGHVNPLKQYGLDLTTASKVWEFLKGLIGGAVLILYVHSVNALLGYACLGRPYDVPSSSIRTAVLLKTYGWILIETLRGIVTATFIAIVEELLFRSWLPEEIAVDLGYHQSIIISAVLFSLLQRSLTSIPGFLFLSLALFGAKQRGNGSLLLPIGIRTGIMTTNFVVQTGGFLYYRSDTPVWLASIHPWRPFDGAVGVGICILMAIFFNPRRPKKFPGSREARAVA